MFKKKKRKTYEIDDRILTLILMVDNLVFESNLEYPEEIRRYSFDYIQKLKEYSGIEEKKYIDWNIKNTKYLVQYNFEENK